MRADHSPKGHDFYLIKKLIFVWEILPQDLFWNRGRKSFAGRWTNEYFFQILPYSSLCILLVSYFLANHEQMCLGGVTFFHMPKVTWVILTWGLRSRRRPARWPLRLPHRPSCHEIGPWLRIMLVFCWLSTCFKPRETWCLVSFKTFKVILAKAVDLNKGSLRSANLLNLSI